MNAQHNPLPVRRLKTYTSTQGYVYQYYFVGKRAALESPNCNAATEYIFDVTSDRKTTFAVSVFIGESSLAGWAANHGRSLTEAEQYAAAKMRLLEGFDQVENMLADGRRLSVNDASLGHLLENLGVT